MHTCTRQQKGKKLKKEWEAQNKLYKRAQSKQQGS